MQRLNATDIKFVKGVGPKRAAVLSAELGIKSVGDLLRHYPSHYVDRTKIYPISSFEGEMPAVQVRGRFVSFALQGEGAKTRLVGLFSDGASTMEVVWFRQIRKLRELYTTMTEYVLFGKPSVFCGRWSMVHPEVESPSDMRSEAGLRPVYPLTEKLRNRQYRASRNSRSDPCGSVAPSRFAFAFRRDPRYPLSFVAGSGRNGAVTHEIRRVVLSAARHLAILAAAQAVGRRIQILAHREVFQYLL